MRRWEEAKLSARGGAGSFRLKKLCAEGGEEDEEGRSGSKQRKGQLMRACAPSQLAQPSMPRLAWMLRAFRASTCVKID